MNPNQCKLKRLNEQMAGIDRRNDDLTELTVDVLSSQILTQHNSQITDISQLVEITFDGQIKQTVEAQTSQSKQAGEALFETKFNQEFEKTGIPNRDVTLGLALIEIGMTQTKAANYANYSNGYFSFLKAKHPERYSQQQQQAQDKLKNDPEFAAKVDKIAESGLNNLKRGNVGDENIILGLALIEKGVTQTKATDYAGCSNSYFYSLKTKQPKRYSRYQQQVQDRLSNDPEFADKVDKIVDSEINNLQRRRAANNQKALRAEKRQRQLVNKFRQAISLVDQGKTLADASRGVGMYHNWLSRNRSMNNRNLFLGLDAYCKENKLSDNQIEELTAKLFNRKTGQTERLKAKFKQAISYVDRGCSLAEASHQVDRSTRWLFGVKTSNTELLVIALEEHCLENQLSSDQKQRLQMKLFNERESNRNQLREVLKQAIGYLDQGFKPSQVREMFGKSRNWLNYYKYSSSETLLESLEEYCQDNQLSEERINSLHEKLFDKKERLNQGQLIERLKEAIYHVDQGRTLAEASLTVGKSSKWLEAYTKPMYAKKLSSTIEAYCQENQISDDQMEDLKRKFFDRKGLQQDRVIDRLKKAIGYLDQGYSVIEASLASDRGKNWLSSIKSRRLETLTLAFEEYCQDNQLSDEQKRNIEIKLFDKNKIDKKQQLSALKAAIGYIDQGDTLKAASLKVGKSDNWMYGNKTHNKRDLKLLLEEYCLENRLPVQRVERLEDKLLNGEESGWGGSMDQLRRAVFYVGQGYSLAEASLMVDKNDNWLSINITYNHDELAFVLEKYLQNNRLSDTQVKRIQAKIINSNGSLTEKSRRSFSTKD